MDCFHDIALDIDTRHTVTARCIAFISAFTIYCIVSALLLLEIVIVYETYRHTQTLNNLQTSSSSQPHSRKPAPVVYAPKQTARKTQSPPPPSSSTATLPAAPHTPLTTPTAAHITPAATTVKDSGPAPTCAPAAPQQTIFQEVSAPSKSKSKNKLKKSVTRSSNLPPATITTPTEDDFNGAKTPSQAVELPAPSDDSHDVIPSATRRRSKGKWFKDGLAPEERTPHPAVAQRPERSGYYSRAIPAYEGDASRNQRYIDDNQSVGTFFKNVPPPEDEGQATEYALFLYKFHTNFCRESRMNPLRVQHALIKAHCITLEANCTKDRKITGIKFLQASYDANLNAYIEGLLRSMSPPLLPAQFPHEVATILIRIRMDRMYQQGTIVFVPAAD